MKSITDHFVTTVSDRLARGQRVRRTLPDGGRLHIDRQLPFLCVYRRPHDRRDVGADRLVKGEASYLVASGAEEQEEGLARLLRAVVETMTAEFGAFLLVEVWTSSEGGKANDPAVPSIRPRFVVHADADASLTRTVEALASRLRRVKILKQSVHVDIERGDRTHPFEMKSLLSGANALRCSSIGVSVPPVFRKPRSGDLFPLILRSLRRSLGLALRQSFFEFARSSTLHQPPHYHALGRRAVVKAVWEVDRKLAEVSNAFDYLLQLTPINGSRSFARFRATEYERVPEFHYRPLPIDPPLLKRKLFRIPIERVEDPVLQAVFLDQQAELSLKITMLSDRDSPRFLFESLQLFGGVDDELLHTANDLLATLQKRAARRGEMTTGAEEFATLAQAEFDFYRRINPAFGASVQLTNRVTGLMVTRGRLLIDRELKVSRSRVGALLAHEVGTHLLTYYNGRQQPFRQLYSGLAGYEELQEGLAVLSEYLVGGLRAGRLRQLAARVVAARQRIDGASFVEVFRHLRSEYGLPPRAAYNIVMRVFRSGGLTKDAIYLRGLMRVLAYVREGKELGDLYVGKMAMEHTALVKELVYRGVLKPAPIQPRHLQQPDSMARLARLKGSEVSLQALVEETESQVSES